MLAVQYLEDGPDARAVTPGEAQACLRAAFERLPLTCVILGWNLPGAVVDACGQEAARNGAQLYRWHPLLAGDANLAPRPEWRVIGLDGEPVPGFQDLPEFTFICPNRPAVQDAALEHLSRVLRRPGYQGVFLDRIRYPSPVAGPARLLGCFCEDCRRVAATERLDLEAVRREIAALLAAPAGAMVLARALLDPLAPAPAMLRAFLDWRVRSITRFVRTAAGVIRAAGLAVGLDCFSPALTYMVGQDLAALGPTGTWIKVMTYGHTLGPAGLPYELLQLAGWLAESGGLGEAEVLQFLSQAARIPLPPSRAALAEAGLPPEALAGEIRRARAQRLPKLLAGIELVRCEGVTHLSAPQITRDLAAFHEAGAGGLVLSWDLWRMPPEWLELVRLPAGAVW